MVLTHLLSPLEASRQVLRPGSWGAYLAASAIVAAATALYLALAPWLAHTQLMTFFAAVLLTTLLCGGAAGSLAVALSALAGWALTMKPAFSLQHIYALAIFCVLAALDVAIVSALQAAAERVRNLNANLRDSEMRYRTLADNASDLITLRNVKLDVQYISPACRRLLGYEPEELRVLRYEDLYHPDDLPTVLKMQRRLSAAAPTIKFVKRLRHKNGAYIWFEVIYNWVAGNKGDPQIVTVARDVTERKAAEDATARIQALLQDAISSIGDGMAIYDAQERLITANAAMTRLAGGPPDLLQAGRTFTDVIDRVRTGFAGISEEAFSAFRTRRATQFRSADGVPNEYLQSGGEWLELRDFRTREGGTVSVASDITALKSAAIELEQARVRADNANAAKSRFLAAASHDLRQPLQTIALLEAILKKRVTDPQALVNIDQLGISLNAMSGMLDTLLEVNQLEAGIVEPTIEDFAIGDLLKRLHGELAYQAEAKGLTLRVVHSNAIVRSDPRLLEHIVRNLLSNAIKYTREGEVLIGCRRRGVALRIDVIDTGIGIPDDQIEAIFEEFHQVDNPVRDRRRGLGLGLSIVQRLSSLLGHPVKVRSRLGRGSVFSVEVPRGELRGAPSEATAVPSPAANSIRILLVEDEEAIRASFQVLLEQDGHMVVAAEDAAHALAYLRQTGWRPEMVVSDYNLPGMNGLELIRAIRSEFCGHVPAVLLTGAVSLSLKEGLSAADCTVLHKPVRLNELYAAIQSAGIPGKDTVEGCPAGGCTAPRAN